MTLPQGIFFDVYQTLLLIESHTPNEALFSELCIDLLKTHPPFSCKYLLQQITEETLLTHTRHRHLGIHCPEIQWNRILGTCLPCYSIAPPSTQAAFAAAVIKCYRTVHLAKGATELLRFLVKENLHLGLISNAQAYSYDELDTCLQSMDLSIDLFPPQSRFFSFEYGFSKPDPYVFMTMTARMEAIGISSSRLLMVGDSIENDISPATKFGWQTWHVTKDTKSPHSGSLLDLKIYLEEALNNTAALI